MDDATDPDDDEGADDIFTCEACGNPSHIGQMTSCGDGGWMCPACAADAYAAFKACSHAWTATQDEWGEDAHVCERCAHLVCDADFPALFGHTAPERRAP